MHKRISAAVALLISTALLPSFVHAQTQQQTTWCLGQDGATPELMINGCTAIIQSGRLSGKDLAMAFSNRGNAYRSSGENDHAIADYDQAIKLYPKSAFAFCGRGLAYKAKGDFERMYTDYSDAILIDPSSIFAYQSTPGETLTYRDAYRSDDYFNGIIARVSSNWANAIVRIRNPDASKAGLGFVIDSSGLIVTSYRTVADLVEINVILSDGSILKADVKGRDQKTDLALLQARTTRSLKPVKFGNSDKLHLGQWMIAIGSRSDRVTMTTGIISGLHRNLSVGPYDNFIQTDAVIYKESVGGLICPH